VEGKGKGRGRGGTSYILRNIAIEHPVFLIYCISLSEL